MKTDITFLGSICRVLGAKVVVEISNDLPSASPILFGRVYRLGQIGSFVRIPLGFLNVYGVVSMIGASDTGDHSDEGAGGYAFSHGQRWIEVQLVGEAFGEEGFQRGVSVFPTIDDEVHIVTENDLSVIYAPSGSAMVPIGSHSASEGLAASVDIDKLVTRHAAIVGSTGSGKSNTVAALLKSLATSRFPGAQVIVIDTHGEYGAAFEGLSRVLKQGAEKVW